MPLKSGDEKENPKKGMWNPDEFEGIRPKNYTAVIAGSTVTEMTFEREGESITQDRWLLQFAPKDDNIQAFEKSMNDSSKKGSLKHQWLQALKDCGVEIDKPEDLEGETFDFEDRDISWGEFGVTDFPFPVKYIKK